MVVVVYILPQYILPMVVVVYILPQYILPIVVVVGAHNIYILPMVVVVGAQNESSTTEVVGAYNRRKKNNYIYLRIIASNKTVICSEAIFRQVQLPCSRYKDKH